MALSHPDCHLTVIPRMVLRMKFIQAALLIICFSVPSGRAQAYQSMGAGPASCGRWITDRREPASADAILDESWVLGFLSGIGFKGVNGDDPLNGLDPEAVFAW